MVSYRDELFWLDAHMVDAFESPESHFLCIRTLSEREWIELRRMYGKRGREWREALCYIVCQAFRVCQDAWK